MLQRDPLGRAVFAGEPLVDLLGRAGCPTPCYVYDLGAMAAEARALAAGFEDAPHLVAYAVKANSAGPVVRALAAAGCGCEVGSAAELELALASGVAPRAILLSGVAKSDAEIDRAIGADILAIQLDSVSEVARVRARAVAAGRRARVTLRVNPDVEADTHAHIATGHGEAKFGIALDDLPEAWAELARAPELALCGLGGHVGSQLVSTDAYLRAAERLFELVREREREHGPLELVDLGGGFGIDYGQGCPVRPADFARGIRLLAARMGMGRRRLVVEPGRALVGPFGVLVAGVLGTKRSYAQRWLMIDAGMNDLLRPALYGARHRVEALDTATGNARATYRVVGPVCESADDFGAFELPDPPPERVLLRDAGAYGYTMASHYNGRALPAEIFVGRGGTLSVGRTGSAADWVRSRVDVPSPPL